MTANAPARIPTNGHILRKRLSSLKPSPENALLYRPVSATDPEVISLAASIKRHGIREPLVVTRDGYILSGHRRYVAAQLAGQLVVPCRVENIYHADDPAAFVALLREYNRQRIKTVPEMLREEVATTDPDAAYHRLVEERQKPMTVPDTVHIEGHTRRPRISEAKMQLLEAAQAVLRDRRDYWPVSLRSVHYCLLSNPPLRNTDDPTSRYDNTLHSYKDLGRLLTRARLIGRIAWHSISDETRPTTTWQSWGAPNAFIRDQLDRFMTAYARDLMQTQRAHVEVVVEKNTVYQIARRVTSRYCIPTSSGRGFASIDAWHRVYERYRRSAKEHLVIIIASDFDPEGEEIVQVAGRTLRDDFGARPEVIKVAITAHQIASYGLPQSLEAKATSSRYKRFTDRHGTAAYELETLTPEQLQDAIHKAIDSVIDLAAYNDEIARERQDAAVIQAARKTALEYLQDMRIGE